MLCYLFHRDPQISLLHCLHALDSILSADQPAKHQVSMPKNFYPVQHHFGSTLTLVLPLLDRLGYQRKARPKKTVRMKRKMKMVFLLRAVPSNVASMLLIAAHLES